jgi:hypothetical protein
VYRTPADVVTRDDRGSMPLAMLLTIVGVALSAILASMLSGEFERTRDDVERVHALNAAQAGLDVAMAHILGASDGTGLFVIANLPCAPVTGTANAGGSGSYTVRVRYYTADPRGHDEDWLAQNGTDCPAGMTPRYAQLTSAGADGTDAAGRRLTATYVFPVAGAANLSGGLIRLHGEGDEAAFCMAAEAVPPIAGGGVLVVPCAAGAAEQTFAYRPNLTIAVGSANHPLGLCLDAGTSPAAGVPVVLQPCESAATARQQWRYDGWRNFAAGGLCLANTGGVVTLTGTCRRPPDRVQTWKPDPAVGPGAAGPAASQLVNGQAFAGCLGADAAAGTPSWSHLRVQPCTQDPNPLVAPWTERWQLPLGGTGPIYLTDPTRGAFCLTAPAPGTSPALVGAEPCLPLVAQPTTRQWTVRGLTDAWPESFRIEDATGRCLASSSLADDAFAVKAVAAACDGTRSQKWNTLAGAFRPRLQDVGER